MFLFPVVGWALLLGESRKARAELGGGGGEGVEPKPGPLLVWTSAFGQEQMLVIAFGVVGRSFGDEGDRKSLVRSSPANGTFVSAAHDIFPFLKVIAKNF